MSETRDETLLRPIGRKGQPEMVERLARAIRKAERSTEQGWIYEIPAAWAALEALCEPTQAMIDAGRWPAEDEGPVACWKAMIGAALALPSPAEKP